MKFRQIVIFAGILLFFLLPWRAVAQTPYIIGRQVENAVAEAAEDMISGNVADAVKKLRGVLAVAPENDAAHYYMGLAMIVGSDYESAEKHLKEAVRLDPGNFWYRYRLSALYGMTGREELTEDMYLGMLRDFPKESELYFDLIGIYVSQKKMDEALETLERIETEFGRSEGTAMTRFDILRQLGRVQEGYESLEEYNREYSSPQVLALLGDRQMSMYNDSTALAMYEEALDIVPDYAPAMLGKAEVYRMTRRYNDYFATLGEFLSLDGVVPAGKADYLNALTRGVDPNFLQIFRPQVDSLFKKTVAVHPSDSSVVLAAGIYYYATGRGDEAVDYFRRNMENWPTSVAAAGNYVELLAYQSRWEELSATAKEAYGKFPSETAFLEMAVLADYNLGDVEKVISTCEKMLEVAPRDTARVVSAYSTMGDMYHQKGDSPKAYKCYDKALKVNPDYLPVLNNYAYYLSLEKKKLKKAASMSRKTVDREPDNPTYLDTYGWILHLQKKDAEAKPLFKHAMLYGGRDNAVILDHYAEVLFALGEYDTAFVYWNQAISKDSDGEVPDLEERVERKRKEAGK